MDFSSKNAKFILEKINLMDAFDAIAGIDAAKSGGMKAAGIGEAYSYAKTDYPINSFSDLLKIAL